MSQFKFLVNEEENTTIIFVDVKWLYETYKNQLQKFQQHLSTLHLRCFNVDLSLFNATLIMATAYVVFNENIEFILDDPVLISSIAILSHELNNGQLWSICSDINGQARGLSRLIIQQCQLVKHQLFLFVDYNNQYWYRALGLYTSLGFSEPQNVEYQERQCLMLTWRESIVTSKRNVRKLANHYRSQYYASLGFNVSTVSFESEQLDFLKSLVDKYREYGGTIGVELNSQFDNFQNYKVVDICDLHSGNYILTDNGHSYHKSGFFTFHTHPKIGVQYAKSILSPPSLPDLINMIGQFNLGCIKHFVIEEQGIWTIQIDPRFQEKICLNEVSDVIKDTIKAELKKLVGNWYNFVNRQEYNVLVQSYLADINNITNQPFLVVYYPWSLIQDGFNDATWYIPCNIPVILKGNICWGFNNPENLHEALDAIDYVGKLDMDRCPTDLVTFSQGNETFQLSKRCHQEVKSGNISSKCRKELQMIQGYQGETISNIVKKKCKDRWENADIFGFLEKYGEAAVTEIYNGAT